MMQFYKEHGADAGARMPADVPADADLDRAVERPASTFELRHAPFLCDLTWIKDLSQPDHLITLRSADPVADPARSTG